MADIRALLSYRSGFGISYGAPHRSEMMLCFDLIISYIYVHSLFRPTRARFAEPSTDIIGAPDMYIESGSTINLTCVILNSPEPPAYIFWNHNNAVSARHIILYQPPI